VTAFFYRRKVAGASVVEAREFMTRVFREVEAKHPGEIAANFLSCSRLGRIKPKRLFAGLLIEWAILGVALVCVPVADRERCLFEFMGSQVAGIMLAPVLIRGSGKRRYLINGATSLEVLLVEMICQSLDPHHYTFGTVLIGFVAGIALFRIVVAEGSGGQPTTVSGPQEPSIRRRARRLLFDNLNRFLLFPVIDR